MHWSQSNEVPANTVGHPIPHPNPLARPDDPFIIALCMWRKMGVEELWSWLLMLGIHEPVISTLLETLCRYGQTCSGSKQSVEQLLPIATPAHFEFISPRLITVSLTGSLSTTGVTHKVNCSDKFLAPKGPDTGRAVTYRHHPIPGTRHSPPHNTMATLAAALASVCHDYVWSERQGR